MGKLDKSRKLDKLVELAESATMKLHEASRVGWGKRVGSKLSKLCELAAVKLQGWGGVRVKLGELVKLCELGELETTTTMKLSGWGGVELAELEQS